MSGGIFISYRRNDNRHAVWWLFEKLRTEFARDQVFMDVTGIEPGLDFKTVIQRQVESCDVLIAVIGKAWLGEMDRLSKEDDLCRFELEAALKRGIRVVPVLVDGAKMMDKGALPPSLHSFSDKQAIRLSSATFEADVGKLVAVLKKDVKPRRKGWFGLQSRTAKPAKPKADLPHSAQKAQVKPGSADPEGPSSSWPLLLPAALALASVPLVLYLPRPFIEQGWTWNGFAYLLQGSIDGVAAAFLLVGLLALLMALLGPRRNALFAALCWLSAALAGAWSAGDLLFVWVSSDQYATDAYDRLALGYLLASLVFGLFALKLLWNRRPASSLEVALYAIGVATGIALAFSLWSVNRVSDVDLLTRLTAGWFVGSLFGLFAVALPARYAGARIGIAALLLFWTTLTLQFLPVVWWLYSTWPDTIVQLISFALASAAAASAVLLLGRARSVQTQT